MYAIIGEDASDVTSLKSIVRVLIGNPSIQIRTKGYEGCGELLRKGAAALTNFQHLGCSKFIVCHDADRNDPSEIKATVSSKIVAPSQVRDHCIVVPVEELEAWILADLAAVSQIIPSWDPPEIANPENINDPKEYLESLSAGANRKARYRPARHNEKVAPHLNLDKVYLKCQSFRCVWHFVKGKTVYPSCFRTS